MRYEIKVVGTLLPILLWACVSMGQSTRATTQVTGPATKPADEVAVIVNGQKIMESDLSELFDKYTQGRMKGQTGRARAEALQMRLRARPRLLDELIQDKLMASDLEKADIKITDKQAEEEMDRNLQAYLMQTDVALKDFEERVKSQTGKSLKEFMVERAASPEFRSYMKQEKLIETKFPDEVKVTDDDIKKSYEADLNQLYKRPEKVKASHILIGTKEQKTDQEKQEARKKAENILAEAKKPGADFAALAKQHSSCPSSAGGGDLGFFPREGRGAMVEEFGAAAFGLKVGEISNVVETRHGYHIIKVTDKKLGETVPLERVKSMIAEKVKREKVQAARQKYIAKLKEGAKIVYPPGKEPATQPALGAVAQPPSSRPTVSRGSPSKSVTTRPSAK